MQPFDLKDIVPSKPVAPFNYIIFILLIHCSSTESRRKSLSPSFCLRPLFASLGKKLSVRKLQNCDTLHVSTVTFTDLFGL